MSAHREGPARARALARQRAAEGPESATAWLKGSHEAIVLHPQWQKLQLHLQELAKVAVRTHLEEAYPQMHPHAIEAVRQISRDIFARDEADELFRGPSQPHLLHEPYMSTEGATGMLGQALEDVARKVDQGAEACGTLESPEFEAFRALVSTVYVGSLQKRVEHVENQETLQAQVSQKEREVLPSKTPQGGWGSNAHQSPNTAHGGTRLSNSKQQNREKHRFDGRTDDDMRTGRGDGVSGVARSGLQACSGDIAQALVAIAMGEGFEHFASPSVGGDGASPRTKGDSGTGSAVDRARAPAKGRRGVFDGGGRGVGGKVGGLAEVGGGSNSSRPQQERKNLVLAAAELRYLSEDASMLGRGGAGRGAGLPATEGRDKHGVGSLGEEGRFPGLGWLTPHIIGRSIPMELRRELWQRTLLRDGPDPAEVERLIIRYARDKGIVDPTNTPIAGMVTTGVRHRAAEAFPWLSHGGQAELELKLRTCREAEKLLNQYFVFVGKHSTRHVASSLLLAYVFSREPTAKKSGEAGEQAERTGAATLVAMLHSFSTRFAPDLESLRRACRAHAYEEIRRRDAPLFEHLNALFPAYKYGIDEGEDSDDAAATPDVTNAVQADDPNRPKGLVEAWLEDAFVGYLREDAVLFVWDHLFLLGWQEQLPLFVADMALHLRTSLLGATNPVTLLSLARDACRRICTRDVRTAFQQRRQETPSRSR